MIRREIVLEGDPTRGIERLGAFMKNAGYQELPKSFDCETVFTRSSPLAALLALHIGQAYCVVRVNPFQTETGYRVVVEWQIGPIYQSLNRADHAYFIAEIDEALAAVRGDRADTIRVEQAFARASRVSIYTALIVGVWIGSVFILWDMRHELAGPLALYTGLALVPLILILRQPGGLKSLEEPNTQAE